MVTVSFQELLDETPQSEVKKSRTPLRERLCKRHSQPNQCSKRGGKRMQNLEIKNIH